MCLPNQRNANCKCTQTHTELDGIAAALYAGRVPSAWLKAYPSLKPLAGWTRDLLARIEQLARWAEGSYPRVYWLGGFTYPTGFLTAVLQTAARRAGLPIDSLAFEYSVVNVTEREVAAAPKEGVYVKGLFLEGALCVCVFCSCVCWMCGGGVRGRVQRRECDGARGGGGAQGGGLCQGPVPGRCVRCVLLSCFAVKLTGLLVDLQGSRPCKHSCRLQTTRTRAHITQHTTPGAGWDFEGGCLKEPSPMELIVPMPLIHFKPVEIKKRPSKGLYQCPLYLYPVRTGTRERPSFMGFVDLKAGGAEGDHWVMRGAALLLSLAN